MTATRKLNIPADYPFQTLNRTLSPRDTMHADSDAHYLSVGLSAISILELALGEAEPRKILDLPCGFGRVTRVLRARFPNASITACDLDREGVDFCTAQFQADAAVSVKDFSQLQLGEQHDLIWVGSLITHLPPLQTRMFLAAMRRHMTGDARLVVSSHGPSIIPRLRAQGYGLDTETATALIDEFENTGFGYRDYRTGGKEYGVALTNEHYGISLTNEAWFRRNLPDCGLRIVSYIPRIWDDHHDIVVARLSGPG
ncbi:class I SAM-dependent methyltransferase [Falsiroseomonas sp. E2-1-a20]|uniref:class I SAM-dependent methyltransferase n=1 Tax=Falsiroseomonas sp. E2-1-a20 TaxID=3239300 RepID=UPI003F3732E3